MRGAAEIGAFAWWRDETFDAGNPAHAAVSCPSFAAIDKLRVRHQPAGLP
jgi:hypothetical protein